MSLLGQIRFILNNDSPSVQNEVSPTVSADRRRKSRCNHKGRRILIVDDSATVVASLGKLLRSAGCVVRAASDAETGLDIARRKPLDLIFLDIILPGINGFSALRHIRHDPRLRHMPVIIISSNEQMSSFRANRIGATDFMMKPFSRFEVFDHLEMLVAEEKLPKLDAVSDVAVQMKSEQSEQSPPQAPTLTPLEEEVTVENQPSAATEKMTTLEARRQLMLMGLQYFSQEQFSDALKRKDKLAVKLFFIGKGIKLQR
jgi:twitching motility two-component system response regulator PilH